jgi:broad specificity phosphatase PhoE
MTVPVSFHDALLERHSGEWEGLTLTEIQALYAADWEARETDPYFHRPPGGENHADMEIRVRELVGVLRRRVSGAGAPGLPAPDVAGLPPIAGPERVAVITHGIMSRVILKLLLELQPADAAALRHPNALFYRLAFTSAGIRQSHYLDGAGPFEGLLRH